MHFRRNNGFWLIYISSGLQKFLCFSNISEHLKRRDAKESELRSPTCVYGTNSQLILIKSVKQSISVVYNFLLDKERKSL